MNKIAIACALLLSGCVVSPPVVHIQTPTAAPLVYQAPAPQPVVSIYMEPPLFQPPPIRVEWAPPPMLVEPVPAIPFAGAIWTGGYWVWEGNWVWAHGRWAPPPQPGYHWVPPYYEHRAGAVVFINGFWAAPNVTFIAPALSINISLGIAAAGVIPGPRPVGPEGVFVPAPPGSHPGLIVPAPIGTAPAVVTGAPPIIRGGMHISVNNNVTNVTNITNVTNVTIIAPASATANGQAVNASIPAQAHLAAAMAPAVKVMAPEPASSKAIPAYVPGRSPVVLPPAQMVHPEMTSSFHHPNIAASQESSAPNTPNVPAHTSASSAAEASGEHPAAAHEVHEEKPKAASTTPAKPVPPKQDGATEPKNPTAKKNAQPKPNKPEQNKADQKNADSIKLDEKKPAQKKPAPNKPLQDGKPIKKDQPNRPEQKREEKKTKPEDKPSDKDEHQ